jgi:hypothetical protein
MIAPCCIVCKRWSNEAGGGFIQFKVVDAKEIEFNKHFFNVSESPPIGHPFGNYFFCDDHTGLGLKYRRFTWKEAEPRIRQAFENNEIPKLPIKNRILRGFLKIIDKFFSKSRD